MGTTTQTTQKGRDQMLNWMQDNLGTLLAGVATLAAVCAAAHTLARDKKKGKSACCGGNCACCGGACAQPPR